MSRNIFIAVIILFLCSCAREEEKNDELYFFPFDQVTHYYLTENIGLVFDEELQRQVLYDFTPTNLSDTSFISSLKELGFHEYDIESDSLSKLREVFKTQNSRNISTYACAATFRDILIFRAKDSISGMAKICFQCEQHHIVGTSQSTFEFGQSGEYAVLEYLLYPDK
ncbi:MAG: hypothetical protein KTR13_00135 [Saprospiraceae bacterium]|nr:hypothetical protein [Saprospiraceae bacterium]